MRTLTVDSEGNVTESDTCAAVLAHRVRRGIPTRAEHDALTDPAAWDDTADDAADAADAERAFTADGRCVRLPRRHGAYMRYLRGQYALGVTESDAEALRRYNAYGVTEWLRWHYR